MEANLQNRITGYWTRRAGAFSAQRRRELAGEKHDQWLAALHRYLPAQGGLRILDLGTGSGFFAMLLAAEGNTVTGIDLTPAMIKEARRAARQPCPQGHCSGAVGRVRGAEIHPAPRPEAPPRLGPGTVAAGGIFPHPGGYRHLAGNLYKAG